MEISIKCDFPSREPKTTKLLCALAGLYIVTPVGKIRGEAMVLNILKLINKINIGKHKVEALFFMDVIISNGIE